MLLESLMIELYLHKKNLFGLFARKAEIYRTWKINASYILSSSAKYCSRYTIILISSYPAQFIYKSGVYDLIEHISRYFEICL